jgi:hypothetical protein
VAFPGRAGRKPCRFFAQAGVCSTNSSEVQGLPK